MMRSGVSVVRVPQFQRMKLNASTGKMASKMCDRLFAGLARRRRRRSEPGGSRPPAQVAHGRRHGGSEARRATGEAGLLSDEVHGPWSGSWSQVMARPAQCVRQPAIAWKTQVFLRGVSLSPGKDFRKLQYLTQTLWVR